MSADDVKAIEAALACFPAERVAGYDEAPVMDADSPLCGPGCDEDVWVTAVYVDVLDVLPSLSREQIDRLTESCLDAEREKREARDADR